MPSDEAIRALLAERAGAPLNYPDAGITDAPRSVAPRGYRLTAYETVLGRGDAVFERACASVEGFEHYPPSFTRVVRESPALELGTGQAFATVARHFGFASVHPCRILRVLREPEAGRFGFSLGTLPGHIGAGEEAFLIEQDPRDGIVRYRVRALSRPDGVLGRLGAPIFRLFQRRFARESQATMRERAAGREAT